MAPVHRRSFLAGLICAPVLAALAPVIIEPPVLPLQQWGDQQYYQTLNGERITGLTKFAGGLYVFTQSAVYQVRL